MKKSLLPIAIAIAGSAAATPFNAGDTKTFSMGGIGVSSADAGQSSIMNPALLATDLRRDLFALEVDLVTVAPKVGGFGEIASDYLDLNVVDRGIDIFETLDSRLNGDDALLATADSLESNISGIGFTGSFNTNVTVGNIDDYNGTNGSVVIGQIDAVNTDLGTLSTNLTTTNSELSATDTQLTAVSNDSSSIQTQLTALNTDVTVQIDDITDDLVDWLNNFKGKDAFVEASVIPISFAMPDRQWGWGIHIDNYIQAGVTLNVSDNDQVFLNNAVDDATGLLGTTDTQLGTVAGNVASDTSTTGAVQVNSGALQTDVGELNSLITSLQGELTLLRNALAAVDSNPAQIDSANPEDPDNTYRQTIAQSKSDSDTILTQITAKQFEITNDTDGSVKELTDAVSTLNSTRAAEVETAVDNITGYSGDNGIVVNDGSGNISVDVAIEDFDSELAIAIAGIEEIGISLAREFVINGQSVSFGVTPKLQIILIEDYVVAINEAEDFEARSGIEPLYRANIDLGAAKEWDWHGTVKAGATLKNLIPYTLKSPSNVEVKMMPKLRVGASHHTAFSTVGIDLDITNNSPFYFGKKTRQIAIGGELSGWGHAALRAGANWNLSDPDDTGVATFGLGLTPFGTGLNFAAWLPFDAFTADYGAVISEASDGEYGSALTTGDKLLRDFGVSANLQIAW